FFSSRRRHTRFSRDWSSDVCSSDLFNLLPVRAFVGGAGPRVERDEVHLGGDFVFAQQAHQFAGVFVAVVFVLQHHVFEGDAAGVVCAGVGGAGGQQFLDAVFAVGWHDFVAPVLGDGVEGDGEVDADVGASAR